MSKIEFMKTINIFTGLTEEYLQILEPLLIEEKYNNNDYIFKENSDSDNLYVIKEGTIKIIKHIVDQEIKVLATLSKGEILGELSIFDNLPRSASAMAYGENEIIIFSISKQSLIDFNYNYPYIMNIILQNIIITLSKRMRNVNEQLRNKVFWGFSTKK